MRDLLASSPSFGLSEFPKLLTGELRLNVPVYTVWGACEDVGILEKIRLAAPSTISTSPPASSSTNTAGISSYSIPNLTVLDEATTRVLLIGGVKLRLFGLGGAVVGHKLFDNGQGVATIAGGGGTMWTTLLQVGEIVDTAMKVRFFLLLPSSSLTPSPLKGVRPDRNPSPPLPRLPRSRAPPSPTSLSSKGGSHSLSRPTLPLRGFL